ncbi:MAG: hypothetical protein JW798_16820 [Prolixibacteraceae bacterium]|nr:hypothetical protein [Prolixibacteraceae bacterium]
MNEELKKALENEFVRKAPKGFSDKVMDKIFEIRQAIIVKPLISKWGWFAIIVACMAFIAFLFKLPVTEKEPVNNPLMPVLETITQQAEKISFQMPDFLLNANIMLLVFGVSIAILLLVGFDRLLFNKKR